MIAYKTNLTDEKRKTLIDIALGSQKNIRKRKVLMPFCAILAVLEIPMGLFFCIKSLDISGIVILMCGFIMLFLAFRLKDFQRFVLRKVQKQVAKQLDVAFREGTVEYIFSDEGIVIKSQVGNGQYYWTAFKEYGNFGEYIFIKRKDNQMILVDKNDLTSNEIDELQSLLSNNINH